MGFSQEISSTEHRSLLLFRSIAWALPAPSAAICKLWFFAEIVTESDCSLTLLPAQVGTKSGGPQSFSRAMLVVSSQQVISWRRLEQHFCPSCPYFPQPHVTRWPHDVTAAEWRVPHEMDVRDRKPEAFGTASSSSRSCGVITMATGSHLSLVSSSILEALTRVLVANDPIGAGKPTWPLWFQPHAYTSLLSVKVRKFREHPPKFCVKGKKKVEWSKLSLTSNSVKKWSMLLQGLEKMSTHKWDKPDCGKTNKQNEKKVI